jgi:hypothetical protein
MISAALTLATFVFMSLSPMKFLEPLPCGLDLNDDETGQQDGDRQRDEPNRERRHWMNIPVAWNRTMQVALRSSDQTSVKNISQAMAVIPARMGTGGRRRSSA